MTPNYKLTTEKKTGPLSASSMDANWQQSLDEIEKREPKLPVTAPIGIWFLTSNSGRIEWGGAVPTTTGTFVLGCKNGVLEWLSTEEC